MLYITTQDKMEAHRKVKKKLYMQNVLHKNSNFTTFEKIFPVKISCYTVWLTPLQYPEVTPPLPQTSVGALHHVTQSGCAGGKVPSKDQQLDRSGSRWAVAAGRVPVPRG